MRKAIYILLISVLAHNTYSQNLVPNPSFEQYTQCPDGASQLSYCNNWLVPTTGTPDYFNACFDSSVAGWSTAMDVPINFLGVQNAIDGNAYSGVYVYYDSLVTYREYIQIQLVNPLVIGTKYYITFYVSLADSCIYATDDIGAYFSNGQITRSDYDAFGYTPNISNPEGNVLLDKNIWYPIQGAYIANGGENYLTIGNFKNNANTDTIRLSPNQPATSSEYNTSYYYIDNICLSTDSLLCSSSIGIEKNENPHNNIFYANGSIYIKGIDYPAAIEIYDITGKVLMKATINDDEQTIAIPDFDSGIYFIRIFNDKNTSIKKIYINKNQ